MIIQCLMTKVVIIVKHILLPPPPPLLLLLNKNDNSNNNDKMQGQGRGLLPLLSDALRVRRISGQIRKV